MPTHRLLNVAAKAGLTALLLSAGLLHCDDPSNGSEDGDLPGPNDPAPVSYRLEAQLDGDYVRAVRIEDGDWSAVGSGQEIDLTFDATGLSNVKQFEFDLEFDPRDAFDLEAARFVGSEPFLAPGTGVQHIDGRLKVGAASFTVGIDGDAALGTLTVRTSARVNVMTQAHIRVIFFSVGPTSTQREDYDSEDLNMGIILNKR